MEALDRATILFTGEHMVVQFRDVDRLSTQFKQMVSFQFKRPVQFIFQSQDGTSIEWWTNGRKHNPFGATSQLDTKYARSEDYYNKFGNLHRIDGPARTEHVYGVSYNEDWINNGILHRDDGPASINTRYGDPNQATWAEFRGYGYPSQLTSDYKGDAHWSGKTAANNNRIGTIINSRQKLWFDRGNCHNENSWAVQRDSMCFEYIEIIQPMNLLRTTRCAHRELRWYDQDEKLHRLDGPAILKLNNVQELEKDGKILPWKYDSWSAEWYVRGMAIPTLNVINWAKKNHILMHNEPCYDHSVFRDSDGELCFITDFIKQHVK